MSEPWKYTVLPITEADTEEVLEFLKRTFFILEPVNLGVGLCQNGEECPDLEAYCRAEMLSGFSLRAAAGDGGATVAAVISGMAALKEDQNGNDLLSQAERCADPKFQRVLYVLAQREATARLWERFPQHEQLLEVKVAATEPTWGRRGLMTALVSRTEQLARARGVSLLRMDTSSAYSARAAERLGFECVSRMLYADCKLRGSPLTVPPHPHHEDCVYVKRLDCE